MKRGTDRKHNRPLGALFFGDFDGPFHRSGMARHDDLTGRVIIGGSTYLTILRCCRRHLGNSIQVKAEDRSHGPLTDRNRVLHGFTAGF